MGALARAIRADHEGRDLVVVGVLEGASVFVADLVCALEPPATIDSVGLWGHGAGAVAVRRSLRASLAGRDARIVEGLLATGPSMRALLDHLDALAPRSVRPCALLGKRERRIVPVTARSADFTIAEGLVVGHRIDLAEPYRDLTDLYSVAPADQP